MCGYTLSARTKRARGSVGPPHSPAVTTKNK